MAGACKAVGALHSAGICHRDVKPANLVLEIPSGEMHVIDFGSAMDTETLLGYDKKRSPVSPRYCPPEKFVDLTKWRTFDTYSIGMTGLRILLSPALRSDNDLDAFNVEFSHANYSLDKWLGMKLSTTALPNRLVAPLTAIQDTGSLATDLWRLLAAMTVADPQRRPDVVTAGQKANAILQKHQRRRHRVAESKVVLPKRFTLPKQQNFRSPYRRVTLEAPVGLDLEETDAGVQVTGIKTTGSAFRLGVPAVGDFLRSFEWAGGYQDIVTLDHALDAARSFPKGGLVEVQYESNATIPKATASRVKGAHLGCARRRGLARTAVEDAAAVAVFGGDKGKMDIQRLDAVDYAMRQVKEEQSVSLKGHRALALIADGHGGQSASRHCALRLPALIDQREPASAVKMAWDRCVEEYVEVQDGVGAVVACVLVDVSQQRGAVLHCGDARVVGVDATGHVVFATADHDLASSSERAAALKRGATIGENDRVQAGPWSVAVPRALGSQTWRNAGIVPIADVSLFDLSTVTGLIVASDGLFDAFSNDDAALYLHSRRLFRPKESPSDIAKCLSDRAANLGSTDDISVAIILLDH